MTHNLDFNAILQRRMCRNGKNKAACLRETPRSFRSYVLLSRTVKHNQMTRSVRRPHDS